jgi:large subunit ribosomal protein L17
MTSRAVGWEILKDKLKSQRPEAIINAGAQQTLDVVKVEKNMHFTEKGILRPKTRWALQKVLQFRDQRAISDLSKKAIEYVVRVSLHSLRFQLLLTGYLG